MQHWSSRLAHVAPRALCPTTSASFLPDNFIPFALAAFQHCRQVIPQQKSLLDQLLGSLGKLAHVLFARSVPFGHRRPRIAGFFALRRAAGKREKRTEEAGPQIS